MFCSNHVWVEISERCVGRGVGWRIGGVHTVVNNGEISFCKVARVLGTGNKNNIIGTRKFEKLDLGNVVVEEREKMGLRTSMQDGVF